MKVCMAHVEIGNNEKKKHKWMVGSSNWGTLMNNMESFERMYHSKWYRLGHLSIVKGLPKCDLENNIPSSKQVVTWSWNLNWSKISLHTYM